VNSVANTVLRNNGAGTTSLILQNTAAGGTSTMGLKFQTAGGSAVIDATKDITISSIINSADNGIAKIGAGNLILMANNTFTGPLSLTNGTVSLVGPQSYTGNTIINSGSQLTVSNDTATIGSGAGTLVLAGGSLYRASQSTSQTHINPLSLTA